MTEISLLNESERPSWLEYPEPFLRIVDQQLVDFTPWYVMDREQVVDRYEGLKNRYPQRELFPFARRDDSDDVACWESPKADKVVIIHDFASAGYEQRETYPSLWDWLKRAIDDMRVYDA